MTSPSSTSGRARPRHKARRTGMRLARFVAFLAAVAVVAVAVVGRVVLETTSLDLGDARAADVHGDVRGEDSADPSTDAPSAASAAEPEPSAGSPDPTDPAGDGGRFQAHGQPTGTPVPRPARQRPEPRIPEDGPGTFRTASAPDRDTAGATTYRVEVEHGLPYTPGEVARMVEQTLSDPRSWGADPDHRLVRVDGESDLRILLAAPTTVDELCAPLDTRGRVSCRNGENVVLNAWRWRNGTEGYEGNLVGYRRYLINHETGHALGYGHVECPGPGELAPVMLQQTLTLDGCRPNPWPARVDLAD